MRSRTTLASISLTGLCAGPELVGVWKRKSRAGLSTGTAMTGVICGVDDGFVGDGRKEALGVGDAIEQAPWDGGIALCGAQAAASGSGLLVSQMGSMTVFQKSSELFCVGCRKKA